MLSSSSKKLAQSWLDTIDVKNTMLFGDVDFDNVAPKSSWITPVPGGVGLMTIVGLLKNTLASAKKEIYG